MVGVNSYIHQLGTVAIFATLFAAIQVNGDKGCIFDFESESDFDLKCNDVKSSWTVNENLQESPKKKLLTLTPEQEGCLKTKRPILLNSTSAIIFRFYRYGAENESSNFTLRLVPKEGTCPDEECVWDIGNDAKYKTNGWIEAEHKFPLKSFRECYVQLQMGKSKCKFFLDRITFPSVSGDSSNCHSDDGGLRVAKEAGMNEIKIPSQLSGTAGNGSEKKSHSPSIGEFSKNLMLTSASVLTLNNLLN